MELHHDFKPTERFPYPTDKTIGFFHDEKDVDLFLRDLTNTGLSIDDVDVLSGEEGLEMIDIDGKSRHSFMDRLTRLSQRFWVSGEWLFFKKADEELRQGHILAVVRTENDDVKNHVVRLMLAYNAHDIKYFNSMYVEHITFDEPMEFSPMSKHP